MDPETCTTCGEAKALHTPEFDGRFEQLVCRDGEGEFDPPATEDEDEDLREGLPEFNGAW
jgi:hypothetical protein